MLLILLLFCVNKVFFSLSTGNNTALEFNSIHPHWDITVGMTLMTQLSLHMHFPMLKIHGYQHFQDEKKSPVFYCSDDHVGQQICSRVKP